MTSAIIVRPYESEDLEEIAYIHTRVWQQAYAGVIPQDYLDRLDPAARLAEWRAIFNNRQKGKYSDTLLALMDGRRAGFLSYGPARDAGREEWAEIYAIYVAQEQAGSGVGFALFESAQEILRQKNYRQAYLWALANNAAALKSYARWGGLIEPHREKQVKIGGATLKEIAVAFKL